VQGFVLVKGTGFALAREKGVLGGKQAGGGEFVEQTADGVSHGRNHGQFVKADFVEDFTDGSVGGALAGEE
jgi:hypothetical protein